MRAATCTAATRAGKSGRALDRRHPPVRRFADQPICPSPSPICRSASQPIRSARRRR
ncbi:hypothetical protein GPA09_15380, partial [Burkholderia pseudomallei]|nr:hypothetical protein [Burkholderia pseudomallei]